MDCEFLPGHTKTQVAGQVAVGRLERAAQGAVAAGVRDAEAHDLSSGPAVRQPPLHAHPVQLAPALALEAPLLGVLSTIPIPRAPRIKVQKVRTPKPAREPKPARAKRKLARA